MRAWLRRMLCRHSYRWTENIHGDAINHHGGMRSWWRCERCGNETLSATLMPDLDALEQRIDTAKNGDLIDLGPTPPPIRDLWDALTRNFYAKKAKREAEEAHRARTIAEAVEAERDRRQKATCDALVAGVEQLERDRNEAQAWACPDDLRCGSLEAAVAFGISAGGATWETVQPHTVWAVLRAALYRATKPPQVPTAVDRVRLENEAAAQSAREYHPHVLTPNPEGPAG